MAARISIVLVTVDCLRADHTGFMGYRRPTTPFLDSLAAESLVFSNAIVAGAPTYYSLPAIMGSRYPLALGRDVLGLAPEEPSLASVLKQAGYATACFSAGNPYISSRFGYEQGFDTFRDYLSDDFPSNDFLNDEAARLSDESGSGAAQSGWASRLNRKIQRVRSTLGPLGKVYDELYFRYCQGVTPVAQSLDALRRFPAADVIVDHAGEWLASLSPSDAPFFLWLHLMDPHGPYYPKEAALELMRDEPVAPARARYLNAYWNRSDIGASRLVRYRDQVVALYDAGIRWADAQLERLVGTLRASRRWEDCIFALTADHGEEFLDHDGRFHPPAKLMEELIHVPLVLRVPGRGKEAVAAPFSMVHLAPTLLDAARLPAPEEFQGQSYWGESRAGKISKGVAISECAAGCTNPFRREGRLGSRVLAIRDGRFKLVLQFDPPEERLYDLEADPGERAPLPSSAEKAARRRLLEMAREHLQRSVERRDQRVVLRARLRDLQLEWARSFPNRQ
jgi:arylsulfatase A-like enzyme